MSGIAPPVEMPVILVATKRASFVQYPPDFKPRKFTFPTITCRSLVQRRGAANMQPRRPNDLRQGANTARGGAHLGFPPDVKVQCAAGTARGAVLSP